MKKHRVSQNVKRKEKQLAFYPLAGIHFRVKITGFSGKTTMQYRENDSSLILLLYLALPVILFLVIEEGYAVLSWTLMKMWSPILCTTKFTAVFQELGAEESGRNQVSCSSKADNERKIKQADKWKDVSMILIFLWHWDLLKSVQNIWIYT